MRMLATVAIKFLWGIWALALSCRRPCRGAFNMTLRASLAGHGGYRRVDKGSPGLAEIVLRRRFAPGWTERTGLVHQALTVDTITGFSCGGK